MILFTPFINLSKICFSVGIATVLMTSLAPAETYAKQAKTTLGWLEHVSLSTVDMELDAKLDSGAKTSSLDAEILTDLTDLKSVLKDDEADKTIIFRIKNEEGEDKIIESELIGISRIKKRGGGIEQRPTVKLNLCLAGVTLKGPVNLTDRSNFNYPMLIGRDMMADAHILINPRAIYTRPAKCAD